MKCELCQIKAVYLCKCSTPNIALCLKHYETHSTNIGVHWVQDLKNGLDHGLFKSLITLLTSIRNRIIVISIENNQQLYHKVSRELKKGKELEKAQQISTRTKTISNLNKENALCLYTTQASVHYMNYIIKETMQKRDTNQMIDKFVEKQVLVLQSLRLADNFIHEKLKALKNVIQSRKPCIFAFDADSSIYNKRHSVNTYHEAVNQKSHRNSYLQGMQFPRTSNPSTYELGPQNPVPYEQLFYENAAVGINSTGRITRCALPGGFFYEGETKHGIPEGKGTLTLPGGSIYQGDFKGGQAEGLGTLINPNGSAYKGEFRNSLRCGQGFVKYSDNSTYEGEFINNKYHG